MPAKLANRKRPVGRPQGSLAGYAAARKNPDGFCMENDVVFYTTPEDLSFCNKVRQLNKPVMRHPLVYPTRAAAKDFKCLAELEKH